MSAAPDDFREPAPGDSGGPAPDDFREPAPGDFGGPAPDDSHELLGAQETFAGRIETGDEARDAFRTLFTWACRRNADRLVP